MITPILLTQSSGVPHTLIVAKDIPKARLAATTRAVRLFYAFWDDGDVRRLRASVAPKFVDRTLPPGRAQGPEGPAFASKGFRAAVPDLRCAVEQQLMVGDRVVSHLRFTGHFTGTFGKVKGRGQRIDFIATDILRVFGGKITDNWHIEDNLTFMKQAGLIPK